MKNLIDEIKKFRNVKIINTPIFQYSYIENEKFLNKYCYVSEVRLLSTIDYIKNNQNIIFHVYEIYETKARWYEEYNEKYIRELRKEKIEKINNNI